MDSICHKDSHDAPIGLQIGLAGRYNNAAALCIRPPLWEFLSSHQMALKTGLNPRLAVRARSSLTASAEEAASVSASGAVLCEKVKAAIGVLLSIL